MNKYLTLKERQQKEVNDFPLAFAFSDKQFVEAMHKMGLKPTDTDKIVGLPGTGGFMLKTDAKAFGDMMLRHEQEMQAAIATDDEFIYQMFHYELGNHEYTYTGTVMNTLSALSLTVDEVKNSERLSSALKKACKAHQEWAAENGY